MPLVRPPAALAGAAGGPLPEIVERAAVEGGDLARERLTAEVYRLSSTGASELTLVLPCAPEDRFAGLGEQFGAFPLRGKRFRGWNFDGAINATYFNAPVLYSSAGWTLIVDTARPYDVDVAAADESEVRFHLEGRSLTAYIVVAPPRRALELLTEMTGRPPLPPGWVFGVWHNVRSGTEAVLEQARRLRSERIPGSVLWVDDHYDRELNHGDGHPGNYPVGAYPDFRELTDGIHELGFKALTYLTALAYTGTPAFESAAGAGILVKREDGGPLLIDFWHPLTVRDALVHFDEKAAAILELTDPRAVAWFRERLRRILLEQGWDGWMQDFGEQYPAAQWHNRFSLLYHAASAAEQEQSKPDSIFFARSGYLGAQALAPCIWGGDQTASWSEVHGLPSVLPAGLSAGLIGVSTWGPDINGLAIPPPGVKVSESTGDKELWLRWAQLGAWTPLMRTHLGFKPKPKRPLDLWYDRETTDAFRRLAETHVRLFPYLQSLAVEAAETGIPILRPLMLEWPDDPVCWDLSDQFLLGPALLVAPVRERGARRRRVYLPAGRWFELHTERAHDGPGWIEVDAPLDSIPVFQRAGTAIPVLPRAVPTLVDPDLLAGRFDLDLWTAPGADFDFTLFDGTEVAIRDGMVSVRGRDRRSSIFLGGRLCGHLNGADVELDLNAYADRVALDWTAIWRESGRERRRVDRARGARHEWRLDPDPPAPREPATVTVVRGGSLEAAEIDLGGEVVALRRGPRGVWTGQIPGRPEGAHVRYRIRLRERGGAWRVLEDAGPDLDLPHRDVPHVRPPSPNYSYVSQVVRAPDWCWDAVIYHVILDRFARSDGGQVAAPEDLRDLDFHGGTLRGLINRLDHVERLGANCLWLSPIYPGGMHVTYDTTDLMAVEPRFGTLDDVRELVAEAHRRGIRLLLDFEVSFLGGNHPFVRAAKRDPASPYRSWFRWHSWPREHYGFFGLPTFATIDHDDPGARRHLVEAAEFWLDLGFDGFRLDSAATASFDFWTEFGEAVRRRNPEAITLAESITGPEHLRHFRGRLTGFLDFETARALRMALTGELAAPEAAEALVAAGGRYPADVFRPVFFENHDMERLTIAVRGDRRRLHLAAALLATVGQAPVVYYGSEVGLLQVKPHDLDLGNRLPMPWDGEQDLDLLEEYRRLLRLRAERPELCRGTFEVVSARRSGLLSYERVLGDRRTRVTANLRAPYDFEIS